MKPFLALTILCLSTTMSPSQILEASIVFLNPSDLSKASMVAALDEQGRMDAAAIQYAAAQDWQAICRWIREDGLGAYYLEKKEGKDLDLNPSNSDLCKVEIHIEGGPFPPFLNVFVQPSTIPGIPAESMPLLNFVGPGVEKSYFWRAPVRSRTITLYMPEGSYFFGGDYFPENDMPDGPMPIAVSKVQVAGSDHAAAGNVYLGFEVLVDADCQLTLSLSPPP